MKIKRMLVTLIFGLGLTLGLVWLLDGGLPVRATTINDVNTTEDELNSDGDCSLREAIQAANTDMAVDGCAAGNGADTILLPAGTYTLTIPGSNEDANLTGDLDITDTLTIVGDGPGQTIINANGIDRVFDIQYGVSAVVISGVTIFNGYVYWDSGGGIDNWNADLTLINTVVLSNTVYAPSLSLAPGGGIAHSGALTLINTSVLSNTATGRGGGVYIRDGSAVLSDTLIRGNTVTGKYSDRGGGGLYVKDSHVTLHGGQIVSNTTEYDGGGVHIRDNTTFTQTGDTLIAYNTANNSEGCGGGVYATSSSVILGEAQILSNTARMGGGVSVNGGSVTLSGTRVISNYAKVNGGGVRVSVGRATLRGAHVLNNTASSGGGIGNGGEVNIENTILAGNRTSGDGAGIYNYNASAITITNSTLSGNQATAPGSDGGALTNNGGTAVLIYTTIVSNTADRCSGGICIYNDGAVWLQNTLLAYNRNSGTISNCHISLSSGGYITSTGHNLENANTCGLTATGDLTDTHPLIGPLTEEYGTWVHPLLGGSPAIDAAACLTGITTDQRGQPRPNPSSSFCDIGAYEANAGELTDLILTKLVTPTSAQPGDPITYTLTFSCTGPSVAVGVVITDSVPVSVTVQSVISSGVTITDTGVRPGYVWQVQALPSGAKGIIIITGVLSSTGLPAGVFTNSGTIGSATGDSDTTNNSSTAGVMVLNVAPMAVNDNYTTGDDVPLTVAAPGVLGNDSDANGDSLTAVLDSGPSSGTLALSVDGSFTYTPTLGFDGTDTFTYYAGDGTVNSNMATVVITVTSVNTPPTISDIPDQTTNVGHSVGPIFFTIGDVETPAGALTLLAGSSDTTLVPVSNIVFSGSGVNRTVTITPTAGLTGITTITITVDDGADDASDSFVLKVEPFRIYLPLVLRNP